MTDEQFNTLSRWEDNFRTATTSKWARHPGRSAMDTIRRIHKELDPSPMPRLQTFCQACVVRELREVGKLYFAEKEAREATRKAEEQHAVEPTPAPKKKSTKKKVSE